MTLGSDEIILYHGDPDFTLAVVICNVKNKVKENLRYIEYVAQCVQHIGH